MLLVIFTISLQFSAVQTFLTKRIANYLSKELNASITLDRIYFKPFSSLEFTNFEWKDENGITIVATNSVKSNFNLSQIFNNKLEINAISIEKAYFNVEIFKDSTNLSSAITYFSSEKKSDNANQNKLKLKLDKIEIKNSKLKLFNHTTQTHNKGVDFSDIEISELNGVFTDIKFDSIIHANIYNFSLKEKSGFVIRQLNVAASYSSKFMEFKNLYLATNRSVLQDYLKFEFNDIHDFSNFLEQVNISANIVSSKVSSKDIEYFAPDLKKVIFQTDIYNANLKGTISNILAKNVTLQTAKNTRLEGDFTIKGLPQINSTIFNFKLRKLQTDAADIENLVSKLANQNLFKLPNQLFKLGLINYEGSFVGLYNDFNLNGKFKTDLGEITSTSKIIINEPLQYIGTIQSKEFAIGKLLNTNIVEKTGLKLNFKGSNLNFDKLSLQFDGYLQNLFLQKYNYASLSLDGNINKKELEVKGAVQDINLQSNFHSLIDWKSDIPKYVLNAKIQHADLNDLHWIKKDSITIHNANISTNIVGNSLNNIVGQLNADSIRMSTTKGKFEINTINFNAEGDEKNRLLTLQSDVVESKINGKIDLNTIIPYFKSLAMRYAPASAIATSPYNPQNFNLEINVKSFKPIAALIDPNLSFDDGAYLNAEFSSENYTASFIAFSPTVTYKGIKLTNLGIQEIADDKAFTLNITADRLNFSDSTYINKINIHNTLANDSLNFNIEMSQKTATNYLNLHGNIHFKHNEPAFINLYKSLIVINNDPWTLNDDALLRVSKGKIYINNLHLTQKSQEISINGIISNEDDVSIKFNKFSLTSLNGLTQPLGVNLKGSMNGNININSILKNPIASANITTSPIIYNEIPIGELSLNADYNPINNSIKLDLSLLDDAKRGLTLYGDYNFEDPLIPLDLKGKLTQIDLTIFQPFLKNLTSNLRGRSNADFIILGAINNPKISGTSTFYNAEFNVNYLKTNYKVNNQEIQVTNNVISLNDFSFNDMNGNVGNVNGLINLSNLSTPYLDVRARSKNLMILNTNFKDNNIYYGTAFATGDFKFKGFTSAIAIDINAQSESGTILNIPFNSAMTVSDNDFIYFISKDSTENQKRKTLFNGLTMNMDLNLTPDAELNLQTNLGSLKGNGRGAIAMKISSLGDFEMFGDYVINNGKFHFTAQDFINKYFDIKQGGTIRWTGNPSEANININALYQQRTAIRPLYNAAGRDGEDERVLAQADMLIKGTLAKPDISFDLNFPQNPYIKDQLQSFLSDANNVNQQALSLIVRRSFTPSNTDQIGKEVNNTLLSAGAEIAFNQINNIISQSLNVDFFDLNIRSFNDASASLRFWDDRLVLTGGITDRTNFQATDLTFFREGITTDAELTYRLRKDGSLMLRAYNRPYTRNFLLRSNDADYISALGLVYRQEFNTLNEFWKKLWFWNNTKKEDKPKVKK